ncbi:CHAP domain-containing protein [Streptococcus dentapri]|uniref:CHAP domain-containing protein n=1 Tax=Streptococcus dentapri TaxID=573564 RepID=A0ABV8CZU1_9STRE
MNKKLSIAGLFTATTATLCLFSQAAVAETYTIQSGDSFFSIADQNGVDPYQLASDNGMTVSSLILPGQTIEVNGAAPASAAPVSSTDVSSDPSVNQNETDLSLNTAVNTYPVGQCTWGVKQLAGWAGDWWGNGGDWAVSASSQGYTVGSTPQAGSIICWTDGGYGHVAYVTEVSADGQIQVLEANYNDQQEINNYRGWFDPNNSVTSGEVSYIYPN